MNAPKAVAGTAILVVAAFWGFILIDLLGVIGDVIVLSAPFAILLAIGAYVVVDSLGVLSVQTRGGPSKAGKKLGALELTILQLTAQRKTEQDIAVTTGVSPSVISAKLEELTQAGFLYENSLSEKGFEALKMSG